MFSRTLDFVCKAFKSIQQQQKTQQRTRLRSRRNSDRRTVESLEPRLLLTIEVEPNNVLASATGFVPTSDNLTGSIGNQLDVDYFSATLSAGDELIVSTDDPFGPLAELVNGSGDVLASLQATDGRLRFTSPTTDTYFLKLSANNEFGFFTGPYEFAATTTEFEGTHETEDNNTIANADPLAGNTHFLGSLADAADVDVYSFQATAGDTVAVKFAQAANANPTTALQAPDGSQIDSDQSGLGIVAALNQTGTYTISLDSANSSGVVTGSYVGQLLLSGTAEIQVENGNDFESASQLDLGPYVISGNYLSSDGSFTAPGLSGSYIDQSLRGVVEEDWRVTQTVAGTRVDPLIHFPIDNWGDRQSVSLTGGTDKNWHEFSVQWDGYVRVVENGTQISMGSDDGSRMWIDVNDDGVFNATELIDNNWGTGQAITLGPASTPLEPGDYRIRIQYEEANGNNEAYLLWSDQARSSGVPSQWHTDTKIGVLSDLDDVDVYSVDFVGTGYYVIRLAPIEGSLGLGHRQVRLYNEFGQLLDYSNDGYLSSGGRNPRAEQTGRHYITVQATHDFGTGPYEVFARSWGEFPVYRDVPLFYHDNSGYADQSHVPGFNAFFESVYDTYQIDLTDIDPGDVERVAWLFETVETGGGGGAGGNFGTRSVNGNGSGRTSATWDELADVWFGLSFHENGHGVGLFHARHPLNTLSYGRQYDYVPIGSSNWLSDVGGNGDARVSASRIQNMRNYLDWALEAGRIVPESESNDSPSTAQWLQPFIDEMTFDADTRNDQAVVVGTLSSPTDIDVFRFTATANEIYKFDIDAAEFQMPLDSMLEVIDSDGNVIATNQSALDRDSGIASVDPFIVHQFAAAGDYFVRVTSEHNSFGNYRLKVGSERTFDEDGPKISAAWPDGGSTVDSTRQLTFWVNDQLDPATLTANNIVITGQTSGVHSGTATFEPITSTLTWQGDGVLPIDTYTVTLHSGSGGITDLYGNSLDGETDGILDWPDVSGNDSPGGDFTSTFTVGSIDSTPASISQTRQSRHTHDRIMFELWFNDELNVTDVYSSSFTLRGAGADNNFNTADDTFSDLDVVYDRIQNTKSPVIRAYTGGVLSPDDYRIEATFLDAAGHGVNLSETFFIGATITADALSTDSDRTSSGLTGSYVDESLRSYSTRDDWRESQTISGTRVDPVIDFSQSYGVRSDVGITDGTDENWDEFSVQWDGYITIPEDGVRISTRSDDGSRLWIDVNNDGNFSNNTTEYVGNSWGIGQPAATGPASVPLAAGTYQIRVQYEEGVILNEVSLVWDYEGGDPMMGGLYSNPQLVDVSVQPNSVVTERPNSIDVTFSQPIATETLTDSSFRLRHSNDHTFFDGNDTFVAEANGVIAWDETTRTATFEPLTPLDNGYYLIELDGDVGGITSSAGRRFDGEYRDANIVGFVPEYGWNDEPSGDGRQGGDYQAMFSVLAAETPPELLVELSTNTISEEQVGFSTAATGTVTRRFADLSEPLDVVIVSSDTSEVGVNGRLTIPAGQASATFPVFAVADTILDGIQTATITASATDFVSVGATVDIVDYETVSIALVSSAAEGAGNLVFEITQSAMSTSDTIVTVTIAGTVTSADYSNAADTVTIPAGETSVSYSVEVVDDNLVEQAESLTVTVSEISAGNSGLSIDTDADGSEEPATITDNDVATFSISDATANESDGMLTFTVSLSNPIDVGALLNVTFTDETTGSADFVHSSVVVGFGPGDNTDKNVSIVLANDTVDESIETFFADINLNPNTHFGTRALDITDRGIGTIVDREAFSLDVDGDTTNRSLTDGILVLRYLAGFVGNPLTSGAVNTVDGQRTTGAEISGWLDNRRGLLLDVDGDREARSLTDGILVLRYLAGFGGESLISGAVNPAGERTTAAEVEAWLGQYISSSPGSVANGPLPNSSLLNGPLPRSGSAISGSVVVVQQDFESSSTDDESESNTAADVANWRDVLSVNETRYSVPIEDIDQVFEDRALMQVEL